jgi:hypothetical protein
VLRRIFASFLLLAVVVLPVVLNGTSAPAQAPSALGCSQQKGYYYCNDVAFLQYFKDAKTAAIGSQPSNRGTDKALTDLVRAQGKALTPEAADLKLALVQPPPDGLFYGPGGRELATLYIYSRTGQLIWVEMLFGQPDTPWPTVVYDVIRQFKDDIK